MSTGEFRLGAAPINGLSTKMGIAQGLTRLGAGSRTGLEIFGGSYRSILSNLLKYDNFTVANYQPGVGVTGALAASAWANQIGAAPALAQASGGNQPFIVSNDYVKKAWLPGVSGNYLSTPFIATYAPDVLDYAVRVNLNDYSAATGNQALGGSDVPNDIAWLLYIDGTGLLNFYWSADGTATGATRSGVSSATVYVALGISDAEQVTLRVLRDRNAGTVKFYGSIDLGVTWTQIGATVTGKATDAIHVATATFKIGANSTGATALALGKFYNASLYSGDRTAGGTLVLNLNASDWPETSTNGTTQVSSTTGETWTLNNTGTKPAQIVGSPSLLFDGAASQMTTAAFSVALSQPYMIYFVGKQISWTATRTIFDKLAGGATFSALYQLTSSANLSMFVSQDGPQTGTTSVPLNINSVIACTFNAASSIMNINGGANITGDVGNAAGTLDGLTLGTRKDGLVPANFQVKEIIIRNIADSAATRAQIQALLKAIHGTP